MPSFQIAQAANAALKWSSPASVVVGGTSGIGRAIAIILAKYSQTGQVHIIGRNQSAADDVLAQMKSANPRGTYTFHQCDVSLISNVRALTSTLRSTLPKINHLVLSQGILSLKGRTETKEGNDLQFMLSYYSRMLFALELIPSLQAAAQSGEGARVMTVMNSLVGDPSKLIWDDLDLKNNFGLSTAVAHGFAMTDLALRELARLHPNIGFIHAYPGWVKTDLGQGLPWYIRLPLAPIVAIKGVRPDVCAEWLMFALTRKESAAGVHFYNNFGDAVENKMESTPEQDAKVWKHTQELLSKA